MIVCGDSRPLERVIVSFGPPGKEGQPGPPGPDFLGRVTDVKTSGYGVQPGEFVPCDASAGGFTVYLPADPVDGSWVVAKKVDESPNTVLVQRTGEAVFNRSGGPSVLQLGLPSQSVLLRFEAGIWHVVTHSVGPAALESVFVPRLEGGAVPVGDVVVMSGPLTPEGRFTAPTGSLYLRSGLGAGPRLFVKESGDSFTGWVAK